MAARHRKRWTLRLALRRRARWTTAFALPMLLLGTMLSVVGLVNAGPAAAATNNTCHYGTGGTDASALCWLDFTGYSDSTALGAGQQFTQAIPGGYTMSFTVKRTATTGTPPVAAHITPTWSGTPFGGNGGQYTGIAGNPALYAEGTFSTTQHNGSWTVNRPGSGGGSEATGEWFSASTEEVPAGVA